MPSLRRFPKAITGFRGAVIICIIIIKLLVTGHGVSPRFDPGARSRDDMPYSNRLVSEEEIGNVKGTCDVLYIQTKMGYR